MIWRYWLISTALLACFAPAAQAADEDLLDLQEKAIKAAVARVAPSVVQVETFGGAEVVTTGAGGKQMMRKGSGPTTGVIVSPDGYVISSAFNFANKPANILIQVPGKGRLDAQVVATDHTRMLTLLKVEAKDLPVPEVAPKKDFVVGQWSVALGRTYTQPDDKQLTGMPSMSIGVLSATNRIWGKAIQTDAKVSPTNYGGPLVDIQGRVQGILVPASPRGEDQTAGIEWYDSGIGFAIPLEDVNAVLPRLIKEKKDLHRGLLGVNLQGADMYSGRPTVASIAPESAAQKSDIRVGDVITDIDGHAIESTVQLQHALGTKYEGDVITVTVERGGKPIKIANVSLTATLSSFPMPFLGVLPMRDDPELGEEVRYVYPDSPAAKAGIKNGDRLMKIQFAGMPMPQPFSGRDELTALLSRVPPGAEIKLEVAHKGGATETVTVKLGSMPDTVPDKLPELATVKKAQEPRKTVGAQPKPPVKPADEKKKPETGWLKRTNSARGHEYWVYVPDDYDPNITYGVVLWLHPAGKGKEADIEKVASPWKDYCEDNHLIFIGPSGESENGWLASESDVLQQIVRDVAAQYNVDHERVVAHGMGVGGQMAFYLGFGARDLIRGVATTGAAPSSAIKENVPNQRLSFYVVVGDKDPVAKDVKESKDKLLANKFPVVFHEIADRGKEYLTRESLAELVRWVDSLDRQ
jgi:S1-C subfamily serine protease